jgi:hypothetical protein
MVYNFLFDYWIASMGAKGGQVSLSPPFPPLLRGELGRQASSARVVVDFFLLLSRSVQLHFF